jgi:hypothetical protein
MVCNVFANTRGKLEIFTRCSSSMSCPSKKIFFLLIAKTIMSSSDVNAHIL